MPLAAPDSELRIAVVSRELYPFGGGGMGNYVAWTARALADVAEVTLLTTAHHRAAYEELRAAGDPRLDERIRHLFVDDHGYSDHTTFYGYFHRWSARVADALRAAYPDRGPDLIEFADYHGEGAVTLQARRTADPWLAGTCVCVRLNSSSEMVLTLDGHLDDDYAMRSMYELERYSLANADRIIWPGGDVLGTYERFYGAGALAPAVRIRHAVDSREERPPAEPAAAPGGEPTRLLFMGRLERRKGIQDLVRALLDLERDDWALTVVGGDTATGPLGVSMRGRLELMAEGDPRIDLRGPAPRERVLDLLDEHDVCVIPSLWECWPNVALEAMQRGRPLLATPTGGLTELVQPGRTGILSDDTGPEALGAALERVLDGELRDLPPSAPRAVYEELTDAEEIRAGYVELAREGRRRRRVRATATPASRAAGDRHRAGAARAVSVVVTYFQLDEYVEEAIESLIAQTHRPLEVIVVNDGSFRPRDRILDELVERHSEVALVSQPNHGLSGARNFGVSQAGGEYVLPFDADNVAEPRLVERLLAALEQDPGIAYATSWSSFIDEKGVQLSEGNGYQPLGNWSRLLDDENVAGDATSLVRREVFDRGLRYDPELTSYEDWYFFRRMRDLGLIGQVVPERLYRYRVRRGSMLRTFGVTSLERQKAEMAAHLEEARVAWTPVGG